MAHFTHFRPFHRYHSYYPYYLPSYYGSFYPDAENRFADPEKYYNPIGNERYLEPTDHLLLKRQSVVDAVLPGIGYERMKHAWFYLILIIALLYVVSTFAK